MIDDHRHLDISKGPRGISETSLLLVNKLCLRGLSHDVLINLLINNYFCIYLLIFLGGSFNLEG